MADLCLLRRTLKEIAIGVSRDAQHTECSSNLFYSPLMNFGAGRCVGLRNSLPNFPEDHRAESCGASAWCDRVRIHGNPVSFFLYLLDDETYAVGKFGIVERLFDFSQFLDRAPVPILLSAQSVSDPRQVLGRLSSCKCDYQESLRKTNDRKRWARNGSVLSSVSKTLDSLDRHAFPRREPLIASGLIVIHKEFQQPPEFTAFQQRGELAFSLREFSERFMNRRSYVRLCDFAPRARQLTGSPPLRMTRPWHDSRSFRARVLQQAPRQRVKVSRFQPVGLAVAMQY